MTDFSKDRIDEIEKDLYNINKQSQIKDNTINN
jgi:hypothetical protein